MDKPATQWSNWLRTTYQRHSGQTGCILDPLVADAYLYDKSSSISVDFLTVRRKNKILGIDEILRTLADQAQVQP